MSSMDVLTVISAIQIIENTVKEDSVLDELYRHISDVLLVNCQTQQTPIVFGEQNYYLKIKCIIINLKMILIKYFDKNVILGKIVSLDFDNPWYSTERTILPNDDITQQFVQNKKISKILTIVCKLIDFLNEYHISKIINIDKQITYLKNKLNEPQKESGVLYEFISAAIQVEIDNHELIKQNYINDFKEIHEISNPIQQYFLNIFDYDFTSNRIFLQNTPITIFNIFQSSLYFLTTDSVFLRFIVKFKSWLPSNYRCIYGSAIIKLYNNTDLDLKNKKILDKFNPDPNLLIDDIITMYWRAKLDPSIFPDIAILNFILINFINKINWHEFDNEKKILFVSIELSLVSKFNKEEIKDDVIYEKILCVLLQSINNIIISNNNLLDSYIIYTVPSVLFSLYDGNYTNLNILINLNNIFRLYLLSRLGIYYLSTMISQENILKLPITQNQTEKFLKYFNYYEHISENIQDMDIIDPISSTVLIIPYVLPMDSDFTMCGMCDKNVIESCLWEKKENPFTRSELTIGMLKEFNSTKKNIELIKNTKKKLNEIICEVKKVVV
jgi:hypothetical protein